jgi:hypothetical protein
MYGTKPSEHSALQHQPYTREPTEAEEAAFARDLVSGQHATSERHYVASLKATRDAVRSRLQEGKALHRIYMVGDWVLKVRNRSTKGEPFYDGPWLVRSVHHGNTYTLASPGGIVLEARYNGALLYPAYVADGHPERSLWYASKTLLEADRRRQLNKVNDRHGTRPATAPAAPTQHQHPRNNGLQIENDGTAPRNGTVPSYDGRRFVLCA